MARVVTLVALTLCSALVVSVSGYAMPNVRIDPNSMTVSGVSAGAYAAVQLHVTFSSQFQGAGILAGGPYWCAGDNLDIALTTCMQGSPVVSELVDITWTTAATGFADDPKNLANDRVWVYSAMNDTIVATSVVKATEAYYNSFLVDPTKQMLAIYDHVGEHAQVTKYWGDDCMSLEPPYINNCDFDAAGSMLSHLFDSKLTVPTEHIGKGKTYAFSQSKYIPLPYTINYGLAEVGYVYVPPSCENAAKECKLHVALHGCNMTAANVGMDFIQKAGYNSWADANDFVLLFPQSVHSTLNPDACFDWWGYSGTDYASNIGIQPVSIMSMVKALIGSE